VEDHHEVSGQPINKMIKEAAAGIMKAKKAFIKLKLIDGLTEIELSKVEDNINQLFTDR
jgi:hypothetical protein